jgi:hypothetical protein
VSSPPEATPPDGGPTGRLGDRPSPDAQARPARVYLELAALWLATLLLIRAVVTLQASVGLPDVVLAAVPLLFIYAPIGLCQLRGADSWAYRLSIPALRDGQRWLSLLRLNAVVIAVIAVPFLVGYHVYQSTLFGLAPSVRFPEDMLTLVAYQLFFVAVPEEFFYRGYFQTRLNEVYPRRFTLFGTQLGMGAVVANLFFAFGHSVVVFQWWHFATFFPGMVFAWMRERTGGVTAGALFHALCNVTVITLDTMYGVR